MKTGKIIAVYGSGFLVGLALVLFPAAASIFTDKAFHDFSEAEYGSIFFPQMIFAIISSLSAPRLAKKMGMKIIMLVGLIGLLLSMVLLFTSQWFFEGSTDYFIVMVATGLLGAGLVLRLQH